MHAVLLAAALAVGTDGSREGATDARMVEVQPYTLLREGMSRKEVLRLMGRPDRHIDEGHDQIDVYYGVGPDLNGRYYQVVVGFSSSGKNAEVQLIPLDRPPTSPRK